MGVLAILVALAIPIALVAGVVAVVRRAGGGSGEAAGSTRRFVTYLLALGVLIVGAVGLAMVVNLLIPDRGTEIIRTGSADVAAAVALTVVGVPAFLLLWRWLAKRLTTDRTERRSPGWALFLTVTIAIFLVGALSGLGSGLAWAVGVDEFGKGGLGYGIVWAGVWAWAWLELRGPRRPERMEDAPVMVGSTVSLAVLAGGAFLFLQSLFDAGYAGATGGEVVAAGLGDDLVRGFIWLALGGAAWWLHWLTVGRLRPASGLRNVYLLVVGTLGGTLVALSAAGGALFVTLTWLLGDPDSSAAAHFSDIPGMVAAFLVGFAVWRYHRTVVTADPEVFETETGRAYRYLLAGVGLIAAASGLGVTVNALLAALVAPVAARGDVDTLLGGITALAIGLPVWWATWTPMQQRRAGDPSEIRSGARRVYLAALAGLGGIVAVVTLSFIVFQLIEGILDGQSFSALIDSTRVPLGLLVATIVVAGYHWAVWRHDRAVVPAADRPVELRRLVLVTSDEGDLAARLRTLTGATVTVWHRSDQDGPQPSAEAVAEALAGITTERALVITAGEGPVQVIPLED